MALTQLGMANWPARAAKLARSNELDDWRFTDGFTVDRWHRWGWPARVGMLQIPARPGRPAGDGTACDTGSPGLWSFPIAKTLRSLSELSHVCVAATAKHRDSAGHQHGCRRSLMTGDRAGTQAPTSSTSTAQNFLEIVCKNAACSRSRLVVAFADRFDSQAPFGPEDRNHGHGWNLGIAFASGIASASESPRGSRLLIPSITPITTCVRRR